MHIILTHEQADFDALASLLGAYLLGEGALAVLPRRMNRNVRAFLTLYGMDLPFIDPRDLPAEPVEGVTLVDTQSMVTLRGVFAATPVQVIDHHPLRDNLPAEWKVTRQDLGATATLLVGQLQERDVPLSTIQSTLLLLGIYEDTGSLTYGRTTAIDLQAAAYLLEQGASLEMAINFLNHPLSLGQQQLYDRLRASSKALNIHGHTVILAGIQAPDLDEELSTVAHKLRDLLDPDGLFVLVTTRSGVQMIARSTSENIDVAAVLSRFGGGGHERAAAGLVKGRTLSEVLFELEAILPEFVRPAITVAEIMSREPQVLRLDTPVEEASVRMRRYGYEGYPVVKNQQVVGLLTRRAVDRAMSHNLHLPASSLMDAGTYTVQPGDSIQHLQRLMTDSGWGQIPVVDPDSGELIGIVTRTDLLKTLAPEARLPGRRNLAGRLEAALPAGQIQLLKIIAQKALKQHAALYIVGGFVRDLLLERPSLDFDLVVEGEAISLGEALQRQYGGNIISHTRFGTAKWYLPEANPGTDFPPLPGLAFVDLISARTEFYTAPTALPTVERGSIKLDLHRRDFTINTLALRLDGHHYGELHDYWGGYNDLNTGQVRVLHSLSFIDDPTRMLRAVRFEQRFGFHIEARTQQLMQEALPLLERVSGDRIRHELNHILLEVQAAEMLGRINQLELLAAIHPALPWDDWLAGHLSRLKQAAPAAQWGISGYRNLAALRRDLGYTLWFMRLAQESAQAVCARLKASVDLTTCILSAGQIWQALPSLATAAPSQVVHHLDDTPPLARFAAYLAADDPALQSVLEQYTQTWQYIQPVTSGHDLRRIGLPPGPIYGRILSALRAAWLDGTVTTADGEQDLLAYLLSNLDTLSQRSGRPAPAAD